MKTSFRVYFPVVLLTLLVACGKTEAPTTNDSNTASDAPVAAAEPAKQTEPETPALAAVEESDGSFDVDAEATEGSLRMAQNTEAAAPARFKEGQHYQRFRPTKMTVGGGSKIEVAEVFWYGCNHCYNLEPVIRQWANSLPDGVEFVQLPVAWPQAEKHAQAFYTIESLAGTGAIKDKHAVHMAIFDAIHVNRERLNSEDRIAKFLERFEVSREDFDTAWSSFQVDKAMRQGKTLSRAYNVQSVPMVVVNGKYVTSETMAGGKAQMLAVIDELVASER